MIESSLVTNRHRITLEFIATSEILQLVQGREIPTQILRQYFLPS